MAFTTVTVTGTFTESDGSNATGTVTAMLNQAMVNGVTTVEPTIVDGYIIGGTLKNQTGGAFTLLATDDVGTTPVGSFYIFTISVKEATPVTLLAAVPHASGTIDISALTPLSPSTSLALTNTLPAPTAALRGQLFVKYGDGKHTGDVVYACLLTTTNGYQWMALSPQNEPIGYFQ